jgi:hypothetical protein
MVVRAPIKASTSDTHARLAVATAAAFVVFISDTYHERN